MAIAPGYTGDARINRLSASFLELRFNVSTPVTAGNFTVPITAGAIDAALRPSGSPVPVQLAAAGLGLMSGELSAAGTVTVRNASASTIADYRGQCLYALE